MVSQLCRLSKKPSSLTKPSLVVKKTHVEELVDGTEVGGSGVNADVIIVYAGATSGGFGRS